MALLPFMLLLGAILFYTGSRYYARDLDRTAKIKLRAEKEE